MNDYPDIYETEEAYLDYLELTQKIIFSLFVLIILLVGTVEIKIWR